MLLVTSGNVFLERLLLLLANLSASRTVPDAEGAITLPKQPFDIYIFDGIIPGGELPPGQLMLINPPENGLFTVGAEMQVPENARTTDHPLAQFLEWSPVHVYETRTIEAPAWADVLVETAEAPLVFIGEQGGRRVAVVGFDLHRSDLPLQIAFPILFANLFEYLAPHGIVENPNGARPNQPVSISPGPGATSVSVSPPQGEPVLLESPGETVLFGGTGQIGFYTVRVSDGVNFQEAVFAVNLFSPAESQIAARDQVRVGQASVPASGENEVSSREIWGWLLALALAFLFIEWLAYHRRLGAVQQKGLK